MTVNRAGRGRNGSDSHGSIDADDLPRSSPIRVIHSGHWQVKMSPRRRPKLGRQGSEPESDRTLRRRQIRHQAVGDWKGISSSSCPGPAATLGRGQLPSGQP